MTTIEWTDEVWNPVMHADRLEAPLRWRKPRRVFVNSTSDLFHEDVPDEFIDRVFAVMALAPQHTFHVLTKWPKRMLRYVEFGSTELVFLAADEERATGARQASGELSFRAHAYLEGQRNGSMITPPTWPLPNVWLGVSWNGRIALLRDRKGADPSEWPEELRVRQFPGAP